MCLFSFELLSALWALIAGQTSKSEPHNEENKNKKEASREPSQDEASQVKGNGLGCWFASAPDDLEDCQAGKSWLKLEVSSSKDELVPLAQDGGERRQYYASNLLDNLAASSRDFTGHKPASLREKKQEKKTSETRTKQATEQQQGEFGANLSLGLVSDDERADVVMASMDLSASEGQKQQQQQRQQRPFRIRTVGRRHLDFDGQFELDNVEAAERSRWSGPFHFIQAADCQFGMIDSYVHHRTQPGWSEEIELCERLVDLCNRQQPRPLFMIICGDLVDSLPNSDIGRRQVVDFKRIFAQLDPQIPLVCVCGNHDVGDEPTPQTVADYRETFGDDYFYFTKNDILFIVINSQFYQNREQVPAEARAQDQWLERLLSKCRLFKYSIVFEHIPWFLQQPDEDNDYFNIRKEVRMGWLRKFKDAGVTKIMCGHYHRNAGGWFEGMELVVTSAIGAQCGTDKSGVRIVKVFEEEIEHQYYAMADIPLSVELKRTTNSSSSSSNTTETGLTNQLAANSNGNASK